MVQSGWKTKWSIGLSLLLSSVVQFPAVAEIVLSGRCHMGQCTQMRFDRKVLLEDEAGEQLYAIETAYRLTPMGEEASGEFSETRRSYVRCSRTRPAYIFQVEGSEQYYSSHLNPGADPAGFAYEAQVLYWTTCHNIIGPDFFSDAMRDRAINLGYPLNLSEDQVSGDSLNEVLQ
ncbi:MAG: hypothetical protein HC795_02485 [Coleofasciculaceae cyanobacterium RL_1_1]|nr:hypothetical protein [Coleofasciculaceae cyanobacterium RL_1_1]